jgi:hypothetical protein
MWYLHAHMFDGDTAAGPVPILFAANPEAAAAAIEAEPAKAHFDLSKVNYITASIQKLKYFMLILALILSSYKLTLVCSGVAHFSTA